MTEIIVVLLSIYAVWSAHRILTLNAILHVVARILEEYFAEET